MSGASVVAAVKTVATKRAAWLVAVTFSAIVTVVKLLQTYEGFFFDALWTRSFVWLVLVNAAFTLALIMILRAFLQPTRQVWFAVVVAASFQALINSSFDTGLAGAEAGTQAGAIGQFNLGTMYNPIEKFLTNNIEEAVVGPRRAELDALASAYGSDAGVKALSERFLQDLEDTSLWEDDKKPALEEEVQAILAGDSTPKQKARAIGVKTLEVFGRGRLKRYTSEAPPA
jgi:hypothetical protein